MADSVTSYTSSTSRQSNVKYQLRVYYKIVSRGATSVTFNMDVHVHYPDKWSSNGAWVKYGSHTKRCNPSARRGYYNWYASTANTSRSDGKYWLKNQTINVGATATTAKLTIGFSNTGYAADTYNNQTVTISFPIGYTDIGKPGTITYRKYWEELGVEFSWGAASAGTNNKVTNYHVSVDRSTNNKDWSNIVDTTVGSGTRSYYYEFGSKDKEGNYYRCNVGARGEHSNSDQTLGPTCRKNFHCSKPKVIEPVNTSIINAATTDLVIGNATDSGGIHPTWTGLGYRASIDGNLLGDWIQTKNSTGGSVTWNTPWRNYVGHTVVVDGDAADGFKTAIGATNPQTVKVGQTMTLAAPTLSSNPISTSTTLTIPATFVDGTYRLYNTTENLEIMAKWSNQSTFQTIYFTTRSSSTDLASIITINSILAQILATLGNSTSSETVNIKCKSTSGHLSAESPVISATITNWDVEAEFWGADDSTTFIFPMNNQVPVTQKSAYYRIKVNSRPNGMNYFYQIKYRYSTSETWNNYHTSVNVTNPDGTWYGREIDISRLTSGTKTYWKIDFYTNASGVNVLVASVNPQWADSRITNEIDKNTIEHLDVPKLACEPTLTRSDFLQNGVSTNQITWSDTFSWDDTFGAKAFIITGWGALRTSDFAAIMDDKPNAILTSTDSAPNYTFNNYYNLASSIVTSTSSQYYGQYQGTTYKLGNKTGTNTAGWPVNKTYDLIFLYTYAECFRSSPTASSPDPDLHGIEAMGSYSMTVSTICPPTAPGTVTWTRSS